MKPGKRLGLLIALAGCLVLLAGAAWERLSSALDAKRNPEPGRAIDVGGRHMQLYCSGKGTPTVILESGLGDVIPEWTRVQTEAARFRRVCSYDRAGYGGSDAGPMPRTSDQIARELHALLDAAGEKPPFVLVGHSFGGYNVRVFNGKYPDEVTGIVLVDTSQDQYTVLPPAWNTAATALLDHYQTQARWAPVLVGFGITRFQLALRGIHVSHLILQSRYLKARASELEFMRISAEQARSAGQIATRPLIVLTAGRNSDAFLKTLLSEREMEQYFDAWVHDLQARLAHLSARGRQIIIPDSGHDMPAERPDAIVGAIEDVIGQGQ